MCLPNKTNQQTQNEQLLKKLLWNEPTKLLWELLQELRTNQKQLHDKKLLLDMKRLLENLVMKNLVMKIDKQEQELESDIFLLTKRKEIVDW